RRLFEAGLDCGYDLIERVGERFQDFVGGNREAARHALGKIAALHFEFLDLGTRERRADFLFDELGRGFADQHAVVAANVVTNKLCDSWGVHSWLTMNDRATLHISCYKDSATPDSHDHEPASIGHC